MATCVFFDNDDDKDVDNDDDNDDDDKVKSASQYLEKIADDLVVTGSVPLCQHSSQRQPDQRADIIDNSLQKKISR